MSEGDKAKVFGIGFHKTGTSSLRHALEILGYRVTGPDGVFDPDIAINVYALAAGLADTYDAFVDNPWPLLFREMDAQYPGSRFILTLRPAEEWIASAVQHFGKHCTPMRQWIYGAACPDGNEPLYMERYEKHNEAVLDYFRGRPDDLLVLNITEGDGWTELCPFLGKRNPSGAFPHRNRKADREKPK